MLRATIANCRAGRIIQGGSTITQQLVKVLFLKPDRTYWRKIEEALLSLSLEYRLEKKQILELYLNRIYFGAGNYGVEAAAQHYFGKSVSKITPYEAAILAGVIKSPTYYAPTTNLARSLERGKLVLTSMRDSSDITEQAYTEALADPPTLRTYLPSESYGYVIDWVVQQLPSSVSTSTRTWSSKRPSTMSCKASRSASSKTAWTSRGMNTTRAKPRP